MKIFNKNTIKCDRCKDKIKKDDKAYCFHSEEHGETYICEPCVKDVYNDYVKFNGDGIIVEGKDPIEE